jgi:DMSO reductase anchor subunit
MLVLTQLSVGAFVCGMLLEQRLDGPLLMRFQQWQSTCALGFGLLALVASTFHLGRPQYAFRAVIGLRHSWLSREIVAFGLFAAAASLQAWMVWQFGSSAAGGPSAVREILPVMRGAVAITGLTGVFCSAMIYVFTQRELWSFGPTITRFLLTSALLGAAASWLTLPVLAVAGQEEHVPQLMQALGPALSRWVLGAACAKLVFDGAVLRHLGSRRHTPLKQTARLMVGPLSNVTLARFAAGLLGGVIMPQFVLSALSAGPSPAGPALWCMVSLMFVACLVGEMLERYLFFAAVASPRMPGGLRR